MKRILLILSLGFCLSMAYGQQFEEIPITSDTDGLYLSSMDFGDIDNNGNIDMVAIGNLDPGATSKIYLNDGNSFIEVPSPFPSLNSGCIELFDADNDGDLDAIMSGSTENFSIVTALFINDGAGNFEDSNDQTFVGLEFSSCTTADVDNDGDIDILMNGNAGVLPRTILYYNDGNGNFSMDTENTFIPADDGDASFVDVDGDGDEDLFVVGWDQNSFPNSFLYINDGSGSFEQSTSRFDGILRGSILPGDFDNDGDMDVVLSGILGPNLHQTKLYLNDGSGKYAESTIATFPNIGNGDLSGSDVDLDGDIDILLSGNEANSVISVTQLYINNGDGSFLLDDTETFDGFILGQTEFIDFNNDGDEDLFMTGLNRDFTAVHKLWENTRILSSVSEHTEISAIDFNVYPNVVRTASDFNVEINSSATRDIDLRIYDSNGVIIESSKIKAVSNVSQNNLLTSPTQAGVYYITLDNGKFSRKLIVID